MKTDQSVIIKNVAVRNGAGLVKSDAVMQLVTVIDTIMENYTTQLTEHQKQLLTSLSEKIEEGLLRVTADTNASTKNSVNAVTEYAKGILPQVMTAGSAEAAKAARGELSGMLMEFTAVLNAFKQRLKVCVIAVTVGAGVVSLSVLAAALVLMR